MVSSDASSDALDEVQQQVAGYEPLSAANARFSNAIVAHAGRPKEWAARVERAAREVAAAFQNHFQLAEGSEGHLHQIVEMSPALIPKVTKQRQEHDELLTMVNRFADRLSGIDEFSEAMVERFRIEAEIVHDAIQMHLARAADLLFEAYFRDAGGEG